MASTTTKAGHFLAKVLGIKLQNPQPFQDEVTRGESVLSIQTNDTFVEEEPSTAKYLEELLPHRQQIGDYIWSLFPFLHWIGHYNLQWLAGDLVAGITVGAVVVPQGMAYALLANLEPQFGLYSSFMGVLIYWFFATSKDITIGPVAVMSTVTGSVVADMKTALPDVPAHYIASALALMSGAIVLFIGLIRCGWIVDLISLTALSAFMTGSAISIAVGQIPTMMGITGFSTRDATYRVFINTLKNLGHTKLDAAMGLTALATLYIIRSGCKYLAKRYPKHQRLIFFMSTLRTVFVILLYTMISWLVHMNLPRGEMRFKILLNVPRGFQNAAVPVLNQRITKGIVSYLPATVIVLLIEHIAISKSFGRVNNYTINPSQEMVAIGVTNLLGPFLGGYPATGSFSRTAIKSKAGVRTPFAGVITAVVVLLAIYALPAVFYYIPSASLSGVIIHAVGDLITPPNTVYQFWRVSPFEVLIFFTGVIVTVFSSIENGIYCTICISAAVLLFRILKAQGQFLGKVRVHSVLGDHVIGDDYHRTYGAYGTFNISNDAAARNVFLPVNHNDGSNPEVQVDNPYPGIFIYRFSEGFNYPNASHSLEYLTNYIFSHTRRTNIFQYDRPGDRPWNDPGPSRRQRKAAAAANQPPSALGVDTNLPTLKAIILDFSSVNNVDITSVQQLIDVRNQLDRYASPDPVDWHIACINNRWTKRALLSAGFGYPAERAGGVSHRWRSIFSVAEIGGSESAAEQAEMAVNEKELERSATGSPKAPIDVEAGSSEASSNFDAKSSGKGPETRARRAITVHGLNRPLFHVDLTSALQSAIANVEARAEVRSPNSMTSGTLG
ncbi:sulfate permease [Phialemonium atrogriseum]|uniref:Sulfate permease n=1 Tax=Phialemonium atrogriseum TaxID=1093897 RepID=A0AAJ0C422_9PEZI|nr:sulfate permease [Phialemonium atrogriseum]KAK1769546.1 sulfate permease [Phialemonium atrogriseum]